MIFREALHGFCLEVDNAIRANVEAGVRRLKTLAPILGPAVAQKRLKVVGGVYDLKTGRVSMVA